MTLTLDVRNEIHLGRDFSNRTPAPSPTNVAAPSLNGNYWVSNLDHDGDRDFIILLSTSKKCRHSAAILCRDSATNHLPSPITPPDLLFTNSNITFVGRDSSVGIATRYGPDGLGIEFRWGRDFPHPSRPAVGSTQPPIQGVPDLSRG